MKLLTATVFAVIAVVATLAGTTPEGIDWLNKNGANDGVVVLDSVRN